MMRPQLEQLCSTLESKVGTKRDGKQRTYNEIRKSLRVWCRGGAFLTLTCCFLIYNTAISVMQRNELFADEGHRLLEGGCPLPANPSALCLPYALGVAYLLLALAVVADEYFVPSLTIIGDYMELSEDVVGATLMAAGGSAPELFTNAAGTFARSDVGFGAIVGSAVFNLLFVIGIVAAIAPRPLQLTWYPITRDSICYVIVLVTLAIFFGVHTPGIMNWYESLILHLQYWLYVLLMRYSSRIQKFLDSNSSAALTPVPGDLSPGLIPAGSANSSSLNIEAAVASPVDVVPSLGMTPAAGSTERKTFRTGVMSMIIKNRSVAQALEMEVAARLVGSAAEVFDQVDKDGSNTISPDELRVCLELLRVPGLTLPRIQAIFDEIDVDKDGSIDRKEFASWFRGSKERVEMEVNAIFDTFDTDRSGFLSRAEIGQVMETMGLPADAASLDAGFKAMQAGSQGDVSRQAFFAWYRGTQHYTDKEASAGKGEEDEEGEEEGLSLTPGDKKGWDLFYYVVFLPIAFAYLFTIPDNKKDAYKGIYWATLTFFICLAWMGLICYFMVDWITVIGATAGIPSVIMGLTFLAAGTSVPDMLGALIVAKRGQGDQAVSSSVGSNVFDICIGLAVPWLLFYAVYQEDYAVGADSLFVSIVIIALSVAFVLSVLKYQGWKHGKASGYLFCLGYFVFVAQQLARVDWKNAC